MTTNADWIFETVDGIRRLRPVMVVDGYADLKGLVDAANDVAAEIDALAENDGWTARLYCRPMADPHFTPTIVKTARALALEER